MSCRGNAEDHCCYVKGERCRFSEDNTVEGRRWACGLRRELGDWDLVLKDERYIEFVAPVFEPLGVNCRDWPDAGKGQRCGLCGGR